MCDIKFRTRKPQFGKKCPLKQNTISSISSRMFHPTNAFKMDFKRVAMKLLFSRIYEERKEQNYVKDKYVV